MTHKTEARTARTKRARAQVEAVAAEDRAAREPTPAALNVARTAQAQLDAAKQRETRLCGGSSLESQSARRREILGW